MIRERESLFTSLFAIIDILLTILCYIGAYYIRKFYYGHGLSYSEEYLTLLLLIVPVWIFLFKFTKVTRFVRTQAYSSLLFDYLKVVSIGLSIVFLFLFAFKLDDISRIVVFLFGFLNLIVLYTSKLGLYRLFKYYRSQGYNSRYIVIFADDNSAEFIRMIEGRKEWGYVIKTIISDSEKIKDEFSGRFNICDNNTDIHNLIATTTIDEVIYAREEFNMNSMRKLVYSCEEIGVVFRMQSNFFSMLATKAELDYMGRIPFLKFTNTPTDYLAIRIKEVIDRVLSLIILILSLPMLLIIALLIKFTSKGPIIFKQKRVGLRGRIFNVYKFRTMVVNAEELKTTLHAENEMDGPVFKIKNDPRITGIGAFLRKTSLDEFPQFFNVLKGDMSIVGPRPPVPKEVAQYERWQLRRLSMKPGITCIWQVSGRNEISFEEWMKLDLQYIDTWSLKLDVILFFKTIKAVITGAGAS